jgi:hypothetical protein
MVGLGSAVPWEAFLRKPLCWQHAAAAAAHLHLLEAWACAETVSRDLSILPSCLSAKWSVMCVLTESCSVCRAILWPLPGAQVGASSRHTVCLRRTPIA